MSRRNNRPRNEPTQYGGKDYRNEHLDALVREHQKPHYVTINFDELDLPSGTVIAKDRSDRYGKRN